MEDDPAGWIQDNLKRIKLTTVVPGHVLILYDGPGSIIVVVCVTTDVEIEVVPPYGQEVLRHVRARVRQVIVGKTGQAGLGEAQPTVGGCTELCKGVPVEREAKPYRVPACVLLIPGEIHQRSNA